MRTGLALLRSCLFVLVFYTGSVAIVLPGAVVSLFSDAGMRASARIWSLYHYACARLILGIRVRIEGQFRDEPVLYAFKHESMFETIELLRYFANPAIVAKRELSSIPIWGWIADRHGLIYVDREGGAAALRVMMRAVRGFVAEGRPIIIFPEGTRTPHGERPPLQAGFAGLYKLFNLPVVPVALDSGLRSSKGSFVRYPGTITVRIGEEIPAGLDRSEIEARVHRAINALND